MFKLIILLKRKNGMSVEEFRNYYETKHIALTRKITPNMKRYTRNYITPYSTDLGANGDSPFDCVTEVYFDSREDFDDQMKFLSDNPDRAAELVEDEHNLFDRSKIWYFTSVQVE